MKAGMPDDEFNLIRWISPSTIKETFVPASDYKYSYMSE